MSEIGVVIAAADRDEQTVADLLTSLRSLKAVGGGWTLHVSNLSRGNYTPPMQEAVARLGAPAWHALSLRSPRGRRARPRRGCWLVAPSGEVLESEESTMLCEVCELLGRLERNGSLRGHIASGLIDLVRACSRGPSPWLPPFYAGGTSPLARSARRLGRRRAPWRACRPRPRAQAGLARNFQNLERNLRQRP